MNIMGSHTFMQECESMDNERGLIMEVKKAIEDLEESRVKILKLISKNPKDEEVKDLLTIVEKTVKAFKNEKLTKENVIEAYGSVEVEIEEFRFIKDERIKKGISVYKIDKQDGLYEYIDVIKISKENLGFINDIESLKKVAIKWYKEDLDNGIKNGDKTLNQTRKVFNLYPIQDGDQYYHKKL